jgi:hypothetical protein
LIHQGWVIGLSGLPGSSQVTEEAYWFPFDGIRTVNLQKNTLREANERRLKFSEPCR